MLEGIIISSSPIFLCLIRRFSPLASPLILQTWRPPGPPSRPGWTAGGSDGRGPCRGCTTPSAPWGQGRALCPSAPPFIPLRLRREASPALGRAPLPVPPPRPRQVRQHRAVQPPGPALLALRSAPSSFFFTVRGQCLAGAERQEANLVDVDGSKRRRRSYFLGCKASCSGAFSGPLTPNHRDSNDAKLICLGPLRNQMC